MKTIIVLLLLSLLASSTYASFNNVDEKQGWNDGIFSQASLVVNEAIYDIKQMSSRYLYYRESKIKRFRACRILGKIEAYVGLVDSTIGRWSVTRERSSDARRMALDLKNYFGGGFEGTPLSKSICSSNATYTNQEIISFIEERVLQPFEKIQKDLMKNTKY